MTNATGLSLQAFKDMLDAYGGDPRRWPEQGRAAAQSLLAHSADARAAFREARALDAVLVSAPSGVEPAQALKERIVAAALSGYQKEAAPTARLPDNVVRIGSRRPSAARTGPPAASTATRPQFWRTATALAASLVTGLLIGTFDIAPSSVRSVAALMSSERDVSSIVAALHSDGLSAVFDEDQL